jgi:hypothetical protein
VLLVNNRLRRAAPYPRGQRRERGRRIRTSRILPAKLVAREPDDFKVVWVRGFQVLVELLEARELRREAAFRGRVDDEDDFVLEVGERVRGAFL